MKIVARVRRRRSGTFQALVQAIGGALVWSCQHDHSYGTSNRAHQDSASKCAHKALKALREGSKP